MKLHIIIMLWFIIWILFSCKESSQKSTDNHFKIEGLILENQGFEKIFLTQIFNNDSIKTDSTAVVNNTFRFEGKTEYPHKALLQFHPQASYFPFILGKESIKISLNGKNLTRSNVSHSELNEEWKIVQQKSMLIYREIDYLFPQMQKARMENDFDTLQKISKKIDSIKVLNQQFLLQYALENIESPLTPLLLNDLYETSKKDSAEILKTIEKLTPEQKKALQF